jgi:TRAP-type C4-dicarboxylate transport system permease small subunit
MQIAAGRRPYERCVLSVQWLVGMLALVAGVAVAVMVVVTCVDVVGRRLGHPLKGAYDIVELLGAIAIAGGLPYTTACRGHVAIELLVQRLPPSGRVAIGTLTRVISILLFGFLTWRFIQYGGELRASHQVTLTLQWPIFWMPYWMALCSGATVLVILHNLMHPGKELMKS